MDIHTIFQEIINFQPFCWSGACDPNDFFGIRIAHFLMIYGIYKCISVGKKEKKQGV